MGIIEDIKKDAIRSGAKIQTDVERELEAKLNQLFYLPKDIEGETEFVKQVMTRGQESQERSGLHGSAIIVSEDKFCYRQQVLSLFYKQLQGEQTTIGLKRIFEEGNAIHEKWQRLFIRGGYSLPEECDKTQFDEEHDLQYTPDILCTIDGVRMVGEIKSVNTMVFKRGNQHASGRKQLQLYMYLTGIHTGFVLQDDKNTQDFRVNIYRYDPKEIQPYITRLENIQHYKRRLIVHNKMVPRHKNCNSYTCKMAESCPMKDVCYKKKKELLPEAEEMLYLPFN